MDFEFEYDEQEPPIKRRIATGRVLGCGGLAAGAGVLMYTAYLILFSGPGASNQASASPVAAGSSAGVGAGQSTPVSISSQSAQRTAQAFLSAWQSGNYTAAAALTDSPAAAKAALDAYRSGLNLSAISVSLKSADAFGGAIFSVSATIADGSAKGTWHYTSQLRVYAGSTGPIVQWQPDVLAPNLDQGMALSAQTFSNSGGTVTDDAGGDLSNSPDPGLKRIASLLAGTANGSQSAGKPGLEVTYTMNDGEPVTSVTPVPVNSPQGGGVTTTIDPKVEAAAISAVSAQSGSSIAVIQPSTGHILAIANNDGFNDDALTAEIAPGSTMKVITSAALLDRGMSMNTAVACPAAYTVTGVTFHNSGGEQLPGGTPLIDDFAQSCNNAFTTQYQQLTDGALAKTARTYFGLDQPWDIGLGSPTSYFTIPPNAEDSELAAETFGQGVIQADPLAMASVAATVDTGDFHQPVLLPDAQQIGATPLPSGTARQLRGMMHAVVVDSDGTASKVGLPSDVYAKTGTADHGAPNAVANSWMIAYDPDKDVAIAALVLGGGYGNLAAGPMVKHVIDAL